MIYYDAHLHLAEMEFFPSDFYHSDLHYAVSCAHSETEWNRQKKVSEDLKSLGVTVIPCLGLFPRYVNNPDFENNVSFLEKLCSIGEIGAIGECGFDLSLKYRDGLKNQRLVFEKSILTAKKYDLPLVLHNVKSFDVLLEYSKELSGIKSVIFHGYNWNLLQSMALLDRNLNAYFSFGANVCSNSPKLRECIKNLPKERILLETDALDAHDFFRIKEVYEAVRIILEQDSIEKLIEENFLNAYDYCKK